MIMKYLKKIIGTLLFAATVFPSLRAARPEAAAGASSTSAASSAPRPNVSGTPDSAETPAPYARNRRSCNGCSLAGSDRNPRP